ncbi:MAG TPA: anti-sigma factor [Gemmatimonadales bacterium]|nr:anti-sigma factor [Gemmatimonadales bacterium]
MEPCGGLALQLTAYVDGELDSVAVAGVEAHLKTCAACAAEVERERQVHAALQMHVAPVRAPAHLRAGIVDAVRDARTVRTARAPGMGRLARWGAMAAVITLAAAGGYVAGGRGWSAQAIAGRRSDLLADELLAAHIRSLQPGHLTDVPSSEHHTVKPWFAGKLDFSPPVPSLDSLGFRLLGGRLDYVNDHPAAALAYARRQHIINLFLWPADSTSPPREETARGYQSVHGAAGGAAYWAISDLNAAELRQFAELVAARIAPTSATPAQP